MFESFEEVIFVEIEQFMDFVIDFSDKSVQLLPVMLEVVVLDGGHSWDV